MNRRGKWAALSAAVVLSLGLGSAAMAEETTLTAVAFLPPQADFITPFRRFADKLNADGKGLLQIRIVGPEAIPPTEQGNALRTGVVDMAVLNASLYKSQVPVGDITYATKTKPLAEMRANGAWAALEDMYSKQLNTRILTLYGNDIPIHLYLSKPIDKLDLKGVNVVSGPTFAPFLSAINGNALIMAPTERFSALERGIASGFTFSLWGALDFGWQKFVKYRVDPGFYNSTIFILGNEKKFASLTDEQKALIDRTVKWFENEDYPSWSKNFTESQLKKQGEAGIQSVDVGPEIGLKADEVFWSRLKEQDAETVDRLRPLVEQK